MNQELIEFKERILKEPLSKTDKYWLEQVDFRTNQQNELNLFVNSEFVKSSIEKKLYKKIKSVYKDVSGYEDCVFVLDKKLKKEKTFESPLVETLGLEPVKEKNIVDVYFDRGEHKYHGRVKTFAETLRKNGLKF